jgi:hypothetical protein
MEATTMSLWVVLASVAGAPTIVAPIHPVAVTLLVAVCRHVGITAASSAALRVTQTRPGIDLVTGTSSLIASSFCEIESGRRRKGFVKGTTWTHYLFVPSWMLIDPDTHVHLPWLAAHPTHGHMLCHPVNVACQFADSELFLSNFNRVPQQTDLNQAQKGHAAFVKTFPAFQQATSLIAYCYEIVSYSVNFGHYVPPPFTITVNEPLGTLFVSLPSIYQTYSLQTTSGALAEASKNPKTKLITLDSFKSIVAGSDGYRMFCDLVALSGQPSLDPYATLPPAPLQTVDQSILDHLHNWELYLDKLLTHGQWLSDRYFIESFHTSAKPEMRTKFTAQLRNDMKSDCPDIDKPLPAKYYPHNLRTAFVMIARGEYGDQKVASMSVREMTRGSRAMTAPEFDMQALREGPGKGIQCHLCQGYGHIARDHCDNGIINGRPHRPSTPQRGSHEPKIREVDVVHSISDSADGSDDASGVTLPVDSTDDADSLAEDAPAVPDFV